jgi:hypothetical protein
LIPGGGYDRLSDVKEQTPVAEYFSHNFNITTFVLYYRLVQPDGTYRYPVPMWDGQRALKFIRYHAHELGIDPNRVGVFGFSAGGHLASTLALHSASDFDLPVHDAVDAMNGRPNFLGLGYPVISMNPAQFAAPSSLAHLLYGYSGHALDYLQDYLSGQGNVTADTPPVFLFERWTINASARKTVSYLLRRFMPQTSLRTYICSRTEYMARAWLRAFPRNRLGLSCFISGSCGALSCNGLDSCQQGRHSFRCELRKEEFSPA